MSKQDRTAARTAQDIEYKYNFKKSFAEVMGVATDARTSAEEAKNIAKNPANNLTHEEIFNLLTDNGNVQGVFRGDDDQLYINAAYIVALEELFAKDITMTGKFESTAMTYLPPTYDDAINTLYAVVYPSKYSLPDEYDFDLNGDGVFDKDDAVLAMNVYKGEVSMADCPGAVKTSATIRIDMSDPEKLIHIYGYNMWGTYVETFIGADPNRSTFTTKDYVASRYIGFKRVLTSADDLDDITEPGVYRFSASSIPANSPYSSYSCIVEVIETDVGMLQRVVVYDGNGRTKQRVKNSAWTSWTQVPLMLISTRTATTNANGNANTGIGAGLRIVDISATDADGGTTYLCNKYWSSSQNRWYVNVTDVTNKTNQANKSFTFTTYYMVE